MPLGGYLALVGVGVVLSLTIHGVLDEGAGTRLSLRETAGSDAGSTAAIDKPLSDPEDH